MANKVIWFVEMKVWNQINSQIYNSIDAKHIRVQSIIETIK